MKAKRLDRLPLRFGRRDPGCLQVASQRRVSVTKFRAVIHGEAPRAQAGTQS